MNSKQKGSAAEYELTAILRDKGYAAERNDQKYVSGFENPDVSLPGVHIEVKRTEALRLYDALYQAVNDSNRRAMPIVAHRKNNAPWVIILRLNDFLTLYRNTFKAEDPDL